MSNSTIKDIIFSIRDNDILLPAMQRSFVWDEKRIVNLFDSIMRGYPIGNLIFWNLSTPEGINKYMFYKFINNFDERSPENQPEPAIGKKSIMVVMDGQQRLTSLYIGLYGSIRKKEKHKSSKKAENYKQKFLYFKPCLNDDDKPNDNEDFKFEFMERTKASELNANLDPCFQYYPISKFLGMTHNDLIKELNVGLIRKNKKDWRYKLDLLREKINDNDSVINYHEIKDNEFDISDVLEIFVRINSGGKPLSKANLLFSTIITSWEDGREKMDNLLKILNEKQILNFTIETVVLGCVYLLNLPASLKGTLDRDTVTLVRDNWDEIERAFINAKNFLIQNSFSDERIASYNAVLPIVYYYYKTGNMSNDVSVQFVKYFCVSQIFSLFGGNSANTLEEVRKHLCKNDNDKLGRTIVDFKLSNLYGINLSAGRLDVFNIDKKKIEAVISSAKYGSYKASVITRLLYLDVELKTDFDLDHICCKKECHKFVKRLDDKEQFRVMNLVNGIANLQLLRQGYNRGEKSAVKPFDYIAQGNQIDFAPESEDNSIYNVIDVQSFEKFYYARQDVICNELLQRLK